MSPENHGSQGLPWLASPVWPIFFFLAALCWRALNSMYGETYYDGFAYIMTARNILSGQLATPYICQGITSHYQPVYPLLIAALNFVTHDLFSSARLVNILAGALLVFPVFAFTREVFGGRAAVYAAALVVINPELSMTSSNAYSEPVFVLTGFIGLWLLWRALDRRYWSFLVYGTAMFIIASLTRAQGVAAFMSVMAGLTAAVLTRRESTLKSLAMLAAALALFFVVIIPSFHCLERSQDKQEVGSKVSQEIYKKLQMYQASSWLIWERKLAESGEKLYWVDLAAEKGPLWPVRERPRLYARIVLRDLIFFGKTLFASPFLPPLLLAPILVLLLFDLARKDFQRGLVLYFVVIMAGTLGSLALVASTVERYLELTIPLFLVLAGAGAAAVEPVIVSRLRKTRMPRLFAGSVPWLFLAAALWLYPHPGFLSFVKPPVRDGGFRQAADTFRPFLDPGRKEIVMGIRPAAPAYTGDYFYILPFGPPDRVVRYARIQKADFILLEDWYLKKLNPLDAKAWQEQDLAKLGLHKLSSIGVVRDDGRYVRMTLYKVEKAGPYPGSEPASGEGLNKLRSLGYVK
jgi:4-amino-4-deoxy-L-arabinose transferase-like glycosyltransferase